MVLAPNLTPLASETADYLRFKKKRLTEKSARGYKAALDEFVESRGGRDSRATSVTSDRSR